MSVAGGGVDQAEQGLASDPAGDVVRDTGQQQGHGDLGVLAVCGVTMQRGRHDHRGKFTERTAATPLITMGARPLAPTRARFLTIDPIEGGCANPYVYVHGDPVNTSDLSGKRSVPACHGLVHVERHGAIRARVEAASDGRAQLSMSFVAFFPRSGVLPLLDAAVVASNWTVQAPSVPGLNVDVLGHDDHKHSFPFMVKGGPGPATAKHQVDVSITYWYIGYTAVGEAGGARTLSTRCLL
jgi:RHS repeat-associated protein